MSGHPEKDAVERSEPITLLGWWFVRVLLRREDKTLEWQNRAAFKNQSEAELYSREWGGVARTEVYQLIEMA